MQNLLTLWWVFKIVHNTLWTAFWCKSIFSVLQIKVLLLHLFKDNVNCCHFLKISKFISRMKIQKWTFCCLTQIRDACLEEDECVLQPRKRPRCHSGDSSSTVTTSSEKWSLSPHIGELFVYLDQSVRNEGILGITVEKTLVCTCSTFKHFLTLSHLL